MVTYYDRLNDAFQMFETKRPASSAQLLMLHLLHEHNANKNCGFVQISDRELELRTRLSKNSITEAKRTLKNLGLIDFRTDKHTPAKATSYFFSDKVGQAAGQEVRQVLGQSGLVSYTVHAGKKEEKETPPSPPKGAVGKGESAKASVRESVKFAQTAVERENLAEFDAKEREAHATSQSEPDVFKVWNDNRMPWLGESQKYRLSHYEEKYGQAVVVKAIVETKDEYTHPTFAKFEAKLKAEHPVRGAKVTAAAEIKKPAESGNAGMDDKRW